MGILTEMAQVPNKIHRRNVFKWVVLLLSYMVCYVVIASIHQNLVVGATVLIECYWQDSSIRSGSNRIPQLQTRATVHVKGSFHRSLSIRIVDVGIPRRSMLSDGKYEDVMVYNKSVSTVQRGANGGIVETTWTGILINSTTNTDRGGYATFVQDSDGVVTGTFTSEDAAYTLIKLPNGSYQVRMTQWKDFPQEKDHPETEDSPIRTSDAKSMDIDNIRADKIVTNKLYTESTIEVDRASESSSSSLSLSSSTVVNRWKKPIGGSFTNRAGINVVDVLVVVTNRAMCEYSNLSYGCPASRANTDTMLNRLRATFVESNNAMAYTEANVILRLVKVIFLGVSFDGKVTPETLETINSNPKIQKWRQNAGADLVSFITGTDGAPVCGLAYLGSFESAVHGDCLDGTLAFIHEIGHNFGCRHDRTTISGDGSTFHPYGHGWQYQGEGLPFRTIMAYECETGPSCGEVPYFSGNGYFFSDGRPMGNATNDNARLIRENASKMANLMKVVPRPTARPVSKPVLKPVKGPRKITIPTQVRPPTTCPDSLTCDLGRELMSLTEGAECLQYCIKSADVEYFLGLNYKCGGC